MFKYVKPLRERLWLRLNDDGLEFHMFKPNAQGWVKMRNQSFLSCTTVLQGGLDGQRVIVHSVRNTTSMILLVNMITSRVVGHIIIDESGAIRIEGGPSIVFQVPLPGYWKHRLTAAIGLLSSNCTINIKDVIANDDDLLRLKHGHRQMFIPNRYLKPTVSYDDQSDEMDRTIALREATVDDDDNCTVYSDTLEHLVAPEPGTAAMSLEPDPVENPVEESEKTVDEDETTEDKAEKGD